MKMKALNLSYVGSGTRHYLYYYFVPLYHRECLEHTALNVPYTVGMKECVALNLPYSAVGGI